jgi:hypothetical protein
MHSQEEIARAWSQKANVFIIQACGSDAMAKFLSVKIDAVIGTNVDIQDQNARTLVSWFLTGLRQGKTIRIAVYEANQRMKVIWKPSSRSETDVPQLTCYGVHVDWTLQQIKDAANKPKK